MSTIAFPVLNRDDDSSASAKLAMDFEARQPCVLPVKELVSADDTLALAAGPCRAETHIRCIEVMNYGFRLNWKKCEVLNCIAAPDRSFPTISYLGSNLDASAAASREICRRLGEAKGQFDKLKGGIRPCTPRTWSVSSKFVLCQSCYIACTQCGWIKRNCRKLMDFKQSAFFPSFVSHLVSRILKCNSVTEKPLQTDVRHFEMHPST